MAALIASEFTAFMKESDPVNYALALEALAREFFARCPGGVCSGDNLWLFLGGLQGWWNGSSANHYAMGTHKQFLEDARMIMSNDRWRSGAAGSRPWTWGNKNQMFTDNEINLSKSGYSFAVDHGTFVGEYTMGYLGVSAVQPGNPLYILSLDQQLARHYYRQCTGAGSGLACSTN